MIKLETNPFVKLISPVLTAVGFGFGAGRFTRY